MPLSALISAAKKTTGTKQTIKAIEKGRARSVYVASDAEPHVIKPLVQLCSERNVPIIYVDSMRKLGEACGIEVACASAAIVEE